MAAAEPLTVPMPPAPPPAPDKAAQLTTLMLRVRDQRDRAAFADLFDHFAPRLKSFMLRLNLKSEEAEDLVQDVMLTVWRQASGFDPRKASATTWIFTIARNRRIDIARRKKLPHIDLDHAPDVESDERADDALIAMDRAHEEARLTEAMGTLPQEQKELLMRAFYDGKTHGDIAAETGLPLGTVKSRIRLGLDRLRRALAGQDRGA